MKAQKTFPVFGEAVEVMISGEETRDSFSMVVQTSPPGGGPPPHRHDKEDEIFQVLEGEFEMFDGKTWTKVAAGDSAYMLRGSVHTFRNCGTTEGKMQCTVVPAGLERYLEELSALKMPDDAERVMAVSAAYGITFLTGETPESAPV